MRSLMRLVLMFALLAAACESGIDEGVAQGQADEDVAQSQSDDVCEGADVSDEGSVVAIYRVTNGELGEVCKGEPNDDLVATWEQLTAVSPVSELQAISALAGFDSPSSDTAAFTAPLFEYNEEFVVAVNLALATDDDDESRLTMVHELTHVFSLEQDQIDFDADPDSCDTFYNGSGCFLEDSYVLAWIDEFWSQEQLDSLPSDGSVDENGGDDRCSIDPSFLGGYAASHPEEDLAESFAAYVFSISVDDGVAEKMSFFDRYPELVAFREQALAAGEDDLPNNFGDCG